MRRGIAQFLFLMLSITALVTLGGCMKKGSLPPATGTAQPQAEYAYPNSPPARYELGNETPMPEEFTARGGVVKIGVLLPLSGRHAEIGQSLQDAAILALFDKYSAIPPGAGVPKVELVPQDTKGTAAGAKVAANAALAEGAQLFIGPLFAHSVEAVAPIARSRGVNIISFSNSKAVASPGVFLFGFDPAEQAARVTEYAMLQKISSIGVLAPNNPYGQTVTDAVEFAAAPFGARINPLVYYSANGRTIDGDVDTFLDEGTRAGRPIFQALMLPDSGDNLSNVVNRLNEKGIRPGAVRYLGTGLWDDPLLRRSVKLMGGWYATSPPQQYDAFEDRFTASYGYQPLRIASLAYDAVALATTLAFKNNFTAAAIADPNGYSGPANGIFRFKRDGTAERGLSVVEVQNNGDVRVVDPAPRSFAR